MATTEYGVRNADGSVSIWAKDDQGNHWYTGKTESWAQNQGITPASAPAPTGGTYNTRNGPKTLQQMQDELRGAGWGGNFGDANAVFSAYQSVGSGGGVSSGLTGGNYEYMNLGVEQLKISAAQAAAELAYKEKRLQLIDQPMLQLEKDKLALQAAQAAAAAVIQAANLQTQEALGALNLAAQLRGPRNAWMQQMVMHGLNAAGLSNSVDAIAGRYTMPSLQAPQAQPQAANLQTLAADMAYAGGRTGQMSPGDIAMQTAQRFAGQYGGGSFTAPGGGGQPATQMMINAEQALDLIWKNRPDLKPFYERHGWDVSTTEKQRAAVQNWLSMTHELADKPRDPLSAVTHFGWYTPTQQTSPQAIPTGTQQGSTFQAPNGQGLQYPWNTDLEAYRSALPAPNQIAAAEWMKLPTSTQEFLLGTYEAMGWDPNDVLHTVKNALPQFKAPSVGTVA